MTTYIHIGLQKTGTTSLQRILHANQGKLSQIGLNYVPRMAGLGSKEVNAHHFLAHCLLNKRYGYTPEVDFSQFPEHVRGLQEYLDKASGIKVISSEDFSRLNPDQINMLREIFRDRDVKVLIYLRRQDSWIDSLYGQMLKVGRNIEVQAYIESQEKMLDFNQTITNWETAFGLQNVILRLYEGAAKENVWNDFSQAVEAPDAINVIERIPQANKSLTYEGTKFLQALENVDAQKILRPVIENIEADREIDEVLTYLSEQQAREIVDCCLEGNSALARRYFNRDCLFQFGNRYMMAGQYNMTAESYAKVAGLIISRLVNRVTSLERKVTAMKKDL